MFLACDLTRWQAGTCPMSGFSSEAGPPGTGVGHGLREFWRARAAAAAVWTCQNSPPAAPAPVPLREGSSTNLSAASLGVNSQGRHRRSEDAHVPDGQGRLRSVL